MAEVKRKFKPLGARVLVKDIITTLSLEERAERAGLHVVIEQENRPRPTQGRVIALGSDPILHDNIKIGDVLFFNPHAGHEVVLEDQVFRMLEWIEITSVMSEEPQSECTVSATQSPDQSEAQPVQHGSATPPEPV